MTQGESVSPIRLLARQNAEVPAWLLDGWPVREPVLRVLGAWPPDRRAVAIVGTTEPQPEARSWAFDFARLAAAQNWTIVSGFARGIDTAAHEGALAANGRTIAVLGQGHYSRFPDARRQLLARIIESGGTVLAFADPEEPPGRHRLLQRNALTSALSLAVIAVQARGHGGTLATMRHAALQTRWLATCPPPATGAAEEWSGNRLLLAETPPWRLPSGSVWNPATALDPVDLEGYVAWLDTIPLPSPPLDTPIPNPETAPESCPYVQAGLFHAQTRSEETV